MHLSTSISKPWQIGPVRKALLLAATAFLVIEVSLNFLLQGRFTRDAIQRLEEVSNGGAPDVEVFGDSVADGGINERLVATRLGLSPSQFINASIPGSTSYWAYPLLKRQVAAGSIPKIIVLAYNDRSYTIPILPKFLGRVGEFSDFRDAVKFRVPAEILFTSIVSRAFFSIRYREELNSIIRSGEGLDYFDLRSNKPLTRTERFALLPLEKPKEVRREQPVEFSGAFHGHPFRPNAQVVASLGAFFQLASEHRIKVLIVTMPKTRRAVEFHDRNGYNQGYLQFMDDLCQSYGATWLFREAEALPATDFGDGVHLTRAAAFDFSERLADLLKTAGCGSSGS
jgi:hypothetical protein